MLIAIIYLIAGLGLLYLGAESLVRGAAALALRTGLTPLAVGLTIVAFGTSTPELAVSASSAWRGLGDVAVGNVVGSNIANVGLILGLCAIVYPMRVHLQLLRTDVPIVLAVSVIFTFLLMDGEISRIEASVLLLGIVVYTSLVLRQARREQAQQNADEVEAATAAEANASTQAGEAEIDIELPKAPGAWWIEVLMVLGGLIGLMLGGHWFVNGAVTIAEELGISNAVVALTVVAVGTSLPELATSFVASIRRQSDIAVGNIVGSNIFNILAIIGASGLISPIRIVSINWIDFSVMIAFAVVLYPMLVTRRELSRVEGAVLLIGYVAYVVSMATRLGK